jgi:hypothetical protein
MLYPVELTAQRTYQRSFTEYFFQCGSSVTAVAPMGTWIETGRATSATHLELTSSQLPPPR